MINKIVIAPDSFKGTLSSSQICEIIARAAHTRFPDCEVVQIPIADGGEGSVDSFIAGIGGEKKRVVVKNPFMEDMEAFYGLVDEETAVVEMAACAGLPLAGERKDPLITTTYGVGQLMIEAVQAGAKKIIVGLGGSATNDGGCGAAAACGVKFFNKEGRDFVPTGGTLCEIDKINISGYDKRLASVEIIAMCDINNPMYGETGAAYIFGPQKGAGEDVVVRLDDGLRHLAWMLKRDLGIDVAAQPGAGAAGAMGAGMIAFFRASLRMGIDVVLDTVHFDKTIRGANFIITGEGSFDRQSLGGKAVCGIAARAKKANIPVLVIAGRADDLPEAYETGINSVFTINRAPEDFSTAQYKSAENLYATADNLFRLIVMGSN